MSRETSLGGPNVGFHNTLWTVILQAKGGEERTQALDHLIRLYWKPVYFYLRRRGSSVEEAKDLTQHFFAIFLEKDFLATFAPERGRFRTFVLAALNHFLAKEYRDAKRLKRGGSARVLSLDVAKVESQGLLPAGTPEETFEREWAFTIVEHAINQLSSECDERGYGKEFAVLRPYLLKGTRHYEALEVKLGRTSEYLARRMFAFRTRLREIIRAIVRDTVEHDEEVTPEMRQIQKIL